MRGRWFRIWRNNGDIWNTAGSLSAKDKYTMMMDRIKERDKAMFR